MHKLQFNTWMMVGLMDSKSKLKWITIINKKINKRVNQIKFNIKANQIFNINQKEIIKPNTMIDKIKNKINHCHKYNLKKKIDLIKSLLKKHLIENKYFNYLNVGTI